MDIVLHQQIPGLHQAASMMYCYPTGSMNVWDHQIEQVLLPAEQAPPQSVEVKVTSGITSGKAHGTWKRRTYRAAMDRLRPLPVLDYSGQFVFDARFDTYRNIAHILDNIAVCVFFGRQALQEHLQRAITIHVIVDARATNLPKEAYRLLGIPLIITDSDVRGEIVTVSEHRIFSVKQKLFEIDFPGYNPDTKAEKIFLPRRGKRSIINNDEVEALLTSQGFKTFYLEDYPIAEQWSITRNAKVAVAVHGAAQSGLIFNRRFQEGEGVKIIGIMSPGWIDPAFRQLGNAVHGQWCAVRGQVTPEVLRATDFSGETPNSLKPPYYNPFKVDCRTLEMALDYLGEGKPVATQVLR